MSEVTRILSAIEQGEQHAAEQLLPLVYNELRKLAAQKLAQEKPGQTLQATGLVHEAYLRLVLSPGRESGEKSSWDGRAHFFAAAAEAMRRILVENARRKRCYKHGGRLNCKPLDPEAVAAPEAPPGVLALDEALTRLAAIQPRAAKLVNLRYFAGLTNKEAAAALGVSARTADADWAYARSWLLVELEGSEG
jgi:RNA polymerase sigma factor (TIGR02999 family)